LVRLARGFDRLERCMFLKLCYYLILALMAINGIYNTVYVREHGGTLQRLRDRLDFSERHLPIRWKKVGDDDAALGVEVAVDTVAELAARVERLEKHAGQPPQE
jgi:hypothetical protein